jgi:predicted regulator of amino acid metabolism with ACT domain
VYATAHPTIANNTDTAVAFNNERRDTAAMHDNVTNKTRLTAVTTGLHDVFANIAFVANATGIRVCWFRVDGTVNIGLDIRSAASADATSFCISTQVYLVAGSYVEVIVKQTSGGNLALYEGPWFSPEAKMRWVGIG